MLENLVGEYVLLFCMNYFYAGKLAETDSEYVRLENPQLVYETGALDAKVFKDAQDLPTGEWFIARSMIESWGKLSR